MPSKIIRKLFYFLKPVIPRRLQIWLRRRIIRNKRKLVSNVWPVLESAGREPVGWPGWPDQKEFAVVLTHDVDTGRGQDRCYQLMALEIQFGYRSLFNFVPERYKISPEIRKTLVKNGFEIGVHGLYHDGKLYQSRKTFAERAVRINSHLKDWHARAFCSPSAHHNLDWIHDLNIDYDLSTFDTDPFEPQPDGVSTIFPFWVVKPSTDSRYLELPYTLAQDFTLFVLMQERSIDIWKQKLDWVARHGGMMLITTHPDYMDFTNQDTSFDEYPAGYYEEFLAYLKNTYDGQYWHGLPRDLAEYLSAPTLFTPLTERSPIF